MAGFLKGLAEEKVALLRCVLNPKASLPPPHPADENCAIVRVDRYITRISGFIDGALKEIKQREEGTPIIPPHYLGERDADDFLTVCRVR